MSIKVLHINCHPMYSDIEHSTVKLSNHGLAHLQSFDQFELDILNLYEKDFFLPKVSDSMFAAWSKSESDLTEDEKNILKRQEFLVNQWIQADLVLIYSPLHNFNVTSGFKDYVDNILIAGRTFRYTENGSVGLLSDKKRVAYIQSSGGVYQQELKYISADIAPHYVRTILSMMGINKMHLIRIEGLDIKGIDKEKLIDHGKTEITNYINSSFETLKQLKG